MMLTGSADGLIRIYRNYDPQLRRDEGTIEMVSGYRALNDIVSGKRGSGLVTEWHQPTGILFVGGDTRVVRVWDAHRELCVLDLETKAQCSVTSLTSEPEAAEIFVAGFADGSIKVFDRRMPAPTSIVQTYNDHQSWVQNVHWQRHSTRELLSGCIDGDIRLWDIRQPTSSVSSWMPHPGGLAGLVVHDQVPVFASLSAINNGSWKSQTAVVHALPPSEHAILSRVHIAGLSYPPRHGPPSVYLPSMTSLAFHPNAMMYGVAGAEGTLTVFGCRTKQQPRQSYELPLPIPNHSGSGSISD
jgi:regulator-associated protein of mTOR